MAPPWEPWAVLNELPRRVKNWLARPGLVSATGMGDGVLSAVSSVEDSSDLLRRRMKALHLDPNDVDRPAAQIAGIRTGLCAHCAARGQCMADLDDEFADPGWGDWRNYCPNATTLSILSTLDNCVEEEQQRPREQDKACSSAAWQCEKRSGETLSQA